MNPVDLKHKADWEGGYYALALYGLDLEDIPRELQPLWEELVEVTDTLARLEAQFEGELDRLIREDET